MFVGTANIVGDLAAPTITDGEESLERDLRYGGDPGRARCATAAGVLAFGRRFHHRSAHDADATDEC